MLPTIHGSKFHQTHWEPNYSKQMQEFENLIHQLSYGGDNCEKIINELDRKMMQLVMQFNFTFQQEQPFDTILERFFTIRTDCNTAYQAITLIELMEKHEIKTTMAPLFKAIAYLIGGEVKKADQLIEKHPLKIQAYNYFTCQHNKALKENLQRVITRAKELGSSRSL